MANARSPLTSKTRFARARLTDSLRARLDAIHARYNTNDTETLIRLLAAYCDAVERADAVRWPIEIAMAAAQPQLRAAEQGGAYDADGSRKAGDRPFKPPSESRRTRGAGPTDRVSRSA
jgi:hypothetical protein